VAVATRLVPAPPLWRTLLRNPMLIISSFVVVLLVFVGIFADRVAPYDPTAIHMGGIIVNGKRVQPPYPPSAQYWFGTDQLGRDIFSRVLYGIRTSLFIGVVVRGGVMLVGITLALIAGQWIGLVRGRILR